MQCRQAKGYQWNGILKFLCGGTWRSRRANPACVGLRWWAAGLLEVVRQGHSYAKIPGSYVKRNSHAKILAHVTNVEHSGVRVLFSGSGSIQHVCRASFVREAERFFTGTGRPSFVRETLERPRSTDDYVELNKQKREMLDVHYGRSPCWKSSLSSKARPRP